MATLKETLNEVQKNNRICPQPNYWDELYKMLPEPEAGSKTRKPPVPLILAAWWVASDADKAKRVKMHIMYAKQLGVLDSVYQFLVQLKEADWHHGI